MNSNDISKDIVIMQTIVDRLVKSIDKIDLMQDSISKQLTILETQLKSIESKVLFVDNYIEKRRNETDSNFTSLKNNLSLLDKDLSKEQNKIEHNIKRIDQLNNEMNELKKQLDLNYVKREQFDPFKKGIMSAIWLGATSLLSIIGTLISKYWKY